MKPFMMYLIKLSNKAFNKVCNKAFNKAVNQACNKDFNKAFNTAFNKAFKMKSHPPRDSIVCEVNPVIIDVNLFLSSSKFSNISHFNFLFISNHSLSMGFNSGE